MEKMLFDFTIAKPPIKGKRTVCGVVGSGNLEIIVEQNDDSTKTQFTIKTSAPHYKKIWECVIQDFIHEYQPAGLKFTMNDNGATPPVVSLRLKQAFELFSSHKKTSKNYLELSARQRILSIVDVGSFTEWMANETLYSPHLAALDLPGEADDGVVIGSAHLHGKAVFIAAQEKDFMGGAVGEIHGAKLTGLFKAAVKHSVTAVILLIDSGGVRLHEANAGEIAISEIIRAIFDTRKQGITTIGVICGKNGAFGGMGIISGCLDHLIVNELARIGVSGPEVIQAVKGIEAFDAQDRGLVWRVYGGKTRYLQQVAQDYVGSDMNEIITAVKKVLDKPIPVSFDFLKQQQVALQKRFQSATDCQEEGEYLTRNFPKLTDSVFEMNKNTFLTTAKKIHAEIAAKTIVASNKKNTALIVTDTSQIKVTLNEVLKSAFTEYTLDEREQVVFGVGKINDKSFHLLGVKESTFLGVAQSLVIAEKLLAIIESKSTHPILLLVDVAGQQLSMQDEWLAMNQYFAHILACLSYLREQNNRLISLIYNQAIGGGFIAYGMMADTILALPHAEVAVMWLQGMSKITKIPLEKLEELSKTSPVFAPGIENFKELAGIHDMVALPDFQKKLLDEANKTDKEDYRAQLGYERGGRKLAYPVIQKCSAIN